MDNYTLEFNGSKIIVKDYASNTMVYKMHFPLFSPEEVTFTNMGADFHWSRSGWEMRNCLSEDSQVYSTISCKQDSVGNLIVDFSTEFDGNVSIFALKFSDKIIEFMNELKSKLEEYA